MNQNILFADLQTWHPERQVVSFPAQQAGQLIECIVSIEKLSQLIGYKVDSAQVLSVFDSLRFDLEDLAEQAIEEELFNLAGEIELG
ncbi:DUF1488 domain-containing protein [Vibrio sp. S11_S32]|uniref:DUF1488 family protein n=2 Tax=Vibrio algicola TaxID=2662262 RepID=A0A5Q0TG34_9VIBR|nr:MULTISPECIES: DUF1488 domain-containing protein [Vibrio]MBD1577312.1 DUF1488 domain-containing protein [Vibrio sp. S11_S32]